MTRMTRMLATVRALTLVVALLTVLAILPPAPVAASVIRVVSLDDTQPEFGAGSRTLTAVIPTTLSNDPISGQVTEPYAGAKLGDQGGLAMAAIRALRWGAIPDSPLPAARTEIGAAVIGNTIWVVGGSSGGTGYQSTVYRGTVNTNYGQPGAGVITWVTSTPLPSVSHADTSTFNIAPRTNAAVAALRTSGNAGYLYVIGGAVSSGIDTFSSNSVIVGDVDANGNLTWRTSPTYKLPSGVGLEGARAFVHTTTAGKTFLYVVGGRNDPPGLVGPTLSNRVYYAEINPSNGNLNLGGDNRTWQFVTMPSSVWNTAVTVGRYTSADGTLTQDLFFIYGGGTSAGIENMDTGTVWKGVINPTTGAITWEDSTTGGNAVIPGNRNSHGAVEFGGAIYLIGGRSGGTINRNGYASYVDPANLRIFKDGALINFYQDDFGALPFAANPGRLNAGVVLVPTSNPNYAFAYLIGGTDGTAPSEKVFRATIGPNQDDQTFYPPTGYYYSKPFSMLDLINEQQATVRKMTWLTNIDPANGGDIKIEYRIYSPSGGNCNETSGGWTEVRDPGAGGGRFSKFNPTGAAYAINSQDYSESERLPPGNCFQYRATFTRGSVQNASPVLLRLGMEVIIPGNPDLNWPANAVTTTQNANGTTRGVEVRLRNQNLTDSGPTQPANVCHASQPGCNPEGTFFVDVFIFPPGATPISPTLPLFAPGGASLSNPALVPYHRACLQIPKNVMQKDVTYLIEENARWSDIQAVGIDGCVSAATNASNGTGKILRDFLDQGSGTYKVILVADTHTDLKGLVYESDVPSGDHVAERNNVSAIFDIVFVAEGAPPPPDSGPQPPPDNPPPEGVKRVFLPLVTR
jgi:hypothetical protein